MDFICFDVSIDDQVAHVQLKRPESLNTMIPEFWTEFPEIIRDISDNARARVIVISAKGKHFSAGLDLSAIKRPAERNSQGLPGTHLREAFRPSLSRLQSVISCIEAARVPVIAAIQGACIGGALDLVSAADCRYATKDAFFCIQEINVGMMADAGTFPRLCQLIPQGLLRELAYTGRRLDCQRALNLGMLNDIYESHEEMIEAVMTTAREIAAKSPLVVAGSKTMINYAWNHSVSDTLDYVSMWQAGMYSPNEIHESINAKSEGRSPDYHDLAPICRDLSFLSPPIDQA